MHNYDVIIIGAGPAGSSAALSLRNTGLNVALFEKEKFPRDKICGDGLCDRSINTLKAISEDYSSDLFKELNPIPIHKAALVYKNHYHTFNFKNAGYIMPRQKFDNFLISKIKRDCANIKLFEEQIISSVRRENKGIKVVSNIDVYFTKMVIFAIGAHSNILRNFLDKSFFRNDNGLAIRAYFKGVKDLQNDCVEFHYKKKYLPGYFWIFPQENGEANVGFGYHLKYAKNYKEDIKTIFREWVNNDLKHRFADAEQISSIKGGLIPFSKNKYNCAGDNYLITGDAASLVDPISGGGIGNAMFSGREAALQAIRCFQNDDFSANETKLYISALKKRMKKEISKRYFLQRAFSKQKWLVSVLAFLAQSSIGVRKFLNWYYK
jgi:geranylgeranyl reductase family protein